MSHNARRMPAVVLLALAALLVVLLAACTSGGLPAPLLSQGTVTSAAIARASVAATLLPSATPQPTATHTPTITPSPTITPAPTATPTVVKGIQDTSTLQDVPVARVIDGNTIEVTIKGTNYQVRYLGIAVPGNGATPEPGGADAAAKNRQLVAGQVVRLEQDVSDTDAEGRLLRYVYTKYYMVNAEMVRLGYARTALQPPDTRYQELLLGMETEARDARRGLWASVWAATGAPGGTPTP